MKKMQTQDSSGDIAEQLGKIIRALEKVPQFSKESFLNIGEHIGDFSGGFAKSASLANSIQDRIRDGNDLGLSQLKADLKKVYNEIKGSTAEIENMISRKAQFSSLMNTIIAWALNLEEDAFVPSITDQIKGQSSVQLEAHTLASVIDSLMQQAHPLIHEIISVTQQAADLMNALVLRISSDLESSGYTVDGYRKSSTEALKRMSAAVKNIDKSCTEMETRSVKVGQLVFDIIGAVQYDDINTQRIEHVSTILRKAEEKLGEKKSHKRDLWFVTALHIAIDQLRDCLKDFSSAFNTIRNNLTAVVDEANRQVQAINVLRKTHRQLRQDSAKINYNITAILGMGLLNDTLSSEVMRALSYTENNIFQAQRSISMLLMSTERMDQLVNTLKTFENRRIKVLTDTISEHAKQITSNSPQKQSELFEMQTLLNEINQAYSDKLTPRLMRTGSMLRRIPLSTQRIDVNNDDLIKTLNQILATTQATAIQVKLLTAEIQFDETIRVAMDKITSGLEALMHKVDSTLAQTDKEEIMAMAAEFEDLKELYTMESERNIHQSAVEGEGASGGEFDDIELF